MAETQHRCATCETLEIPVSSVVGSCKKCRKPSCAEHLYTEEYSVDRVGRWGTGHAVRDDGPPHVIWLDSRARILKGGAALRLVLTGPI